jgi:hypothetical protein
LLAKQGQNGCILDMLAVEDENIAPSYICKQFSSRPWLYHCFAAGFNHNWQNLELGPHF